MKNKVTPPLVAIVLILGLAGCSTYQTPGGKTRLGDPAICKGSTGSAICALGVGAIVAGAVAVAAQ